MAIGADDLALGELCFERLAGSLDRPDPGNQVALDRAWQVVEIQRGRVAL
jgi:hypothetical protein